MIRNLKALGLALVAVFAFSAMAAASASATDAFTVEGGGSATVTGVGTNNVFFITQAETKHGVEVSCAKAHFESTLASGATHTTVKALYTGTTAEPTSAHCGAGALLGKAEVKMNGCDYELTGTTTGSDVHTTGADATISVLCAKAGEHIEIITSSCTIKVPAQTPTEGGVTYTNEAGGKVTIHATVTGITYTSTGGLCSLGGISSEGNNSDYTGTVTVAATNGKAISVS